MTSIVDNSEAPDKIANFLLRFTELLHISFSKKLMDLQGSDKTRAVQFDLEMTYVHVCATTLKKHSRSSSRHRILSGMLRK